MIKCQIETLQGFRPMNVEWFPSIAHCMPASLRRVADEKRLREFKCRIARANRADFLKMGKWAFIEKGQRTF